MKSFVLIVVAVSLLNNNHAFKIGITPKSNLSDYFNSLKEFCDRRFLIDFCSKEQIQLSRLLINAMKLKQENILRENEKLRKRKEKEQKLMENKLRMHFLDRHF